MGPNEGSPYQWPTKGMHIQPLKGPQWWPPWGQCWPLLGPSYWAFVGCPQKANTCCSIYAVSLLTKFFIDQKKHECKCMHHAKSIVFTRWRQTAPQLVQPFLHGHNRGTHQDMHRQNSLKIYIHKMMHNSIAVSYTHLTLPTKRIV